MKVRLRFAKTGKVRFVSHRDMARILERGVRRIGLPMAYSEGFNPRPKLSFGLALTVGYESVGEYFDLDLASAVDLTGLAERLTAVLPEGIDVQAAIEITPRTASLQEAVTSCAWLIDLEGDPAALTAGCEAALAATEIMATRQRKGKESVDDLRPGLLALDVVDHRPGGIRLTTELATQPRSLRPSELLAAALPDAVERRVVRTHQWIERDDTKVEPIAWVPSATSAPGELVSA